MSVHGHGLRLRVVLIGALAGVMGVASSAGRLALPEGALPYAPTQDAGGLRGAVVRVEVPLDPFSMGPGLVAELAARQPWTPYQEELARRLKVGSTGSGFFVNARGDLVTNAHVVLSGVRFRGLHFTPLEWDSMRQLLEAVRKVWVTVGEGGGRRCYLATTVALAEELDLAVLRVSLPPGEPLAGEFAWLPIREDDQLAVGAEVAALGFPEDEFEIAHGKVVSLIQGAGVHDDLRITRRPDPQTGQESVLVSGATGGPVGRFQHSAATGHGNSGGPIVDRAGRVVGVAYALLTEAEGNGPGRGDLNLAITSRVLRRFLREHGVECNGGGKAEETLGRGQERAADARDLGRGQEQAPAQQDVGPYAERERLVEAHRRAGRYEDAYHEAAWLAWLAPKEFAESDQGARYLRDRRARDRAASASAGPVAIVVAAADAQRWLYDCCFNGAIAQQAARLQGEVADLISRSEKAVARTAAGEAVVRMGMARLYLALDDLMALSDGGARARAQALRTAASEVAAASATLPEAPGPHRTLATIRARLAELGGGAEMWEQAISECEQAYRLDPEDSVLPEMLWDLNLRAGHWREAERWEAMVTEHES